MSSKQYIILLYFLTNFLFHSISLRWLIFPNLLWMKTRDWSWFCSSIKLSKVTMHLVCVVCLTLYKYFLWSYKFLYTLITFYLHKEKIAKASIYFTLLIIMSLQPLKITNKQTKGACQQISYLNKIIRTVQRSQTLYSL